MSPQNHTPLKRNPIVDSVICDPVAYFCLEFDSSCVHFEFFDRQFLEIIPLVCILNSSLPLVQSIHRLKIISNVIKFLMPRSTRKYHIFIWLPSALDSLDWTGLFMLLLRQLLIGCVLPRLFVAAPLVDVTMSDTSCAQSCEMFVLYVWRAVALVAPCVA